MTKRIVFSVVGFVLLMHTRISSATLLYDNGDSSWSGASNISGWVVADDFSLRQEARLSGVSVDLWGATSYDFANFAGMKWWLFANDNGDPGDLLNSGISHSFVPTFIGVSPTGTVNFWTLFFELEEEVSVPQDTIYWLGLRLSNQSEPISWSNSLIAGFDDAQSEGGTFDNWEHASNPLFDKAFSLYGTPVPTPSAVIFLGTCLFWLFGIKTFSRQGLRESSKIQDGFIQRFPNKFVIRN